MALLFTFTFIELQYPIRTWGKYWSAVHIHEIKHLIKGLVQEYINKVINKLVNEQNKNKKCTKGKRIKLYTS